MEAGGLEVPADVRLERLDHPPAARRTAPHPLPEGGRREGPDRGPDHEVVAFDEGDRSAGQRDDCAKAVEGLEQDLVQVELAGSGGCDIEDQLCCLGRSLGVGDGSLASLVAHPCHAGIVAAATDPPRPTVQTGTAEGPVCDFDTPAAHGSKVRGWRGRSTRAKIAPPMRGRRVAGRSARLRLGFEEERWPRR
jgi:hypothetical protein